MIDLLEGGSLYPLLDLCVDVRAAYDAVAATYVCEPAGSSLKLHFISVRDKMAHGLIRTIFWVDTRDMLADGLTQGGVDKTFLHNVSNACRYRCVHDVLLREKKKTLVSSSTTFSSDNDEGISFEHRT